MLASGPKLRRRKESPIESSCPLLSDKEAPPFTPLGQKMFDERYTHPDALTLNTMMLTDPKIYTKTWSGSKTYKMELPKGLTVLSEWYCVPSEEESINQNVRDPATGLGDKTK